MAQLTQLPGAQPERKFLSFYNHLDEDKSHIRLISIHPDPTPNSRSIVRCSIEQVSLSDFCVPYARFLSTIIDVIDSIGAAHIPYGKWQPESIVQPPLIRSAYNSLDGTKDALARTLYGDRASRGDTNRILGRALLSLPRDAMKAVHMFQELQWENFCREIWTNNTGWSEWRTANSEFLIAGRRFDDYFEDEEPKGGDDTDVYDAYMSWVRTHHGRRLIVTTNGYVGWVPDKSDRDTTGQVIPGDLIAIVYGCSTPLVLRKVGDAYRIIGEGYLHGFMEGEVSGLLASGTLQSQDLVLF